LDNKSTAPSLHGANRHRDVAVPAHHYSWEPNPHLGELSLQLKSVHIWQADIDNNASWRIINARI
jgi:hypothetical protein